MKRADCIALSVFAMFLIVIVAFFVASLVLSQQHSLTLVQEWQSWFGIKENVDVVANISLNTVRGIFRI